MDGHLQGTGGVSSHFPRTLPQSSASSKRLPSTFMLPWRGFPRGDRRPSVQVAAERRAVPCLVVLVGEGALVGFSRLRHNHGSPPGDRSARVCHWARPVFQALFVSSLQVPRVLYDVQRVDRVKSPPGTADDGPHVVLFGTRRRRAAVVLQRGTLRTDTRQVRGQMGKEQKGDAATAPHRASTGLVLPSSVGRDTSDTSLRGEMAAAISTAERTAPKRAGWGARSACRVVLQQDEDESLPRAGCAHHASLLHTLRNEVGLRGAMGTLQIFAARQETACNASSETLASLG